MMYHESDSFWFSRFLFGIQILGLRVGTPKNATDHNYRELDTIKTMHYLKNRLVKRED